MQTALPPQGTIQVKYFTKEALDDINTGAILDGRRYLSDTELAALAPDKKFPISAHTESDDYVTTDFVINEDGDTCSIDLTFKEWNSLPVKGITQAHS